MGKAALVVAVEANPLLVRQISEKFPKEVANGRLVVVGAAVSTGPTDESVSFYVHRRVDVLSQFDKPDDINEFEEISVVAISVHDLLERFGKPTSIKIDLEH